MLRSSFHVLVVLALASSGCPGCGEDPKPPAPAVSAQLPPELAASLPKTDAGHHVLFESTAMLPEGVSLVLAYDENRDDPLVRWAECVGRVAGCYKTNSGSIAGCVDFIEVCADPSGGIGCCPQACITQFQELLHQGRKEEEAIDESFARGDCVAGFTDFTTERPQP
jgi:hypothetical protein